MSFAFCVDAHTTEHKPFKSREKHPSTWKLCSSYVYRCTVPLVHTHTHSQLATLIIIFYRVSCLLAVAETAQQTATATALQHKITTMPCHAHRICTTIVQYLTYHRCGWCYYSNFLWWLHFESSLAFWIVTELIVKFFFIVVVAEWKTKGKKKLKLFLIEVDLIGKSNYFDWNNWIGYCEWSVRP